MMAVRGAFSEKDRVVSVARPAMDEENPGAVQQQFLQESNINHIVSQYVRTRVLPNSDKRPIFGDFTEMGLQQTLNKISDMEQQFMSLPAKLRNRFSNNPVALVRFVNDPRNLRESLKLGLLALPEGYVLDKNGEPVLKAEESPLAPKEDAESNPHKKAPEAPAAPKNP